MQRCHCLAEGMWQQPRALVSACPDCTAEPEPNLGSSSLLLAETTPLLPLGLLMASSCVPCSKHPSA